MTRRIIAYQYLGFALVFLLLVGLLMQFQRDIRGTLLVFFVTIPVLFAAFGNFVLSFKLGRAISIFRFDTAAVILFDLAALLALAGVAHTSAIGFDFVMALDFASILLCSTAFIVAIRTLRKDVGSWFQLPFYLPTLLLTAIILTAATFLLEVSALAQIGWSLVGLPSVRHGPLPEDFPHHHLAFHFFWFLGHPEVYVFGLFLLGLVAELARRIFCRR